MDQILVLEFWGGVGGGCIVANHIFSNKVLPVHKVSTGKGGKAGFEITS